MNKNITNLVKFLCCILIYIHHYYLGSPSVSTLGRTACCIFFFLSAYGISKSIQQQNVNIISFFQRRLSKIYLPLLLVNVVTLSLCFLMQGHLVIPIFDVFCNKITTIENSSVINNLLFTSDIKQMDSVTWFIDVLLIGYLFLWVIGQIKSKEKRIRTALSCYFLLITSQHILPPPTTWYLIDTSGFIAGFLYAEFEKHINIRKRPYIRILTSIFILSTGFSILLQGVVLGRYIKILTVIYSLSACAIVAYAANYHIKVSPAICSYLCELSFFVYLTHIKIANVYHEFEGRSFLLVFLITVIAAIALNHLNKIVYKTLKL